MSILFRKRESRAIDSGAFDRMMSSTLVGGDRALRLAPVYSAVRLLSDSLAKLPLHTYRKGPGRRERVEPYSLTDSPSLVVSPFAWKFQAMTSLLLRGNAYGLILARNSDGVPTQIEWVNPTQVRVEAKSLARWDYYWGGDFVPPDQILHVQAFPQAGAPESLSPVSQFAATFDAGLSAVDSLKGWYQRSATPSMHIQNSKKTLNPDEASKVKERFKATLTTGEPVVTGMDWSFDTIGVSAQDAQYLEGIKATANMVAAIYGVPPEMIGGETSSSLTYATTEQHDLQFQTNSLLPWVTRLEDALSALLPRPYFVKFNLKAGVRADAKTEAEITALQLKTGQLTQDEGRLLSDRDPLTPQQKAEWLELYGTTKPKEAQ